MIVFAASKQMNLSGSLRKIKLNKHNEPIYFALKNMNEQHLSKFLKIKNKTLETTYQFYNSDKVIYNQAIDAYEGLSFRQIESRNNLHNFYIISALNGITRADKLIFNYRLDFTNRPLAEQSLYNYHQKYITKIINKDESKMLLNLASREYFKAIDCQNINKQVIDLEIYNDKINSVFLKKMRGQLANHCLENNITNYYDLVGFENDLFMVEQINDNLLIKFKEQ